MTDTDVTHLARTLNQSLELIEVVEGDLRFRRLQHLDHTQPSSQEIAMLSSQTALERAAAFDSPYIIEARERGSNPHRRNACDRRHATSALTTFPLTSVSLKRRPWYRYVNRS
jgi:hypothetical protein